MTVFRYRDHRADTERTLTWVWIALVAITIGSWTLAPAHITHAAQASVPVTMLVLALTFVKSRMIIGHFMEVHTAPRWLRRATDGWLAALIATVFVIYLF
ncbi:cytochrome C oxidase subunit IV family protein [Mycolicibacillus parakoreensis]|uniref:Cytochrome C oxidase subunit IV family protein n=1 Tax=Mycolicibacillus parakoreensis TaxID=1069221 RepID=A0ABY3TYS3_9MYCO|nr:cytochrome C oxidase subunit IV family protein [Mycolicibacillus parakoreensis]MCV7317167.1 cytochrome C oxidase subunit IV family protein [Mycolicibacillus parakoreensis]ULN51486.1 cytochrome C oxidase subunit IV family protein [Mycolicibacillus parakoreensis]